MSGQSPISEREHLAALLRREGRYSGVWFADHLLKAADLIDEAQSRDAVIEECAAVADLRVELILNGEYAPEAALALLEALPDAIRALKQPAGGGGDG